MLYLNDASRNVRYISFAVSSTDHTNLDLHTLPVNGSIRILQVINARMITRGTILLFSKTTEDASPSCSLIISTLHFLKVFDI